MSCVPRLARLIHQVGQLESLDLSTLFLGVGTEPKGMKLPIVHEFTQRQAEICYKT